GVPGSGCREGSAQPDEEAAGVSVASTAGAGSLGQRVQGVPGRPGRLPQGAGRRVQVSRGILPAACFPNSSEAAPPPLPQVTTRPPPPPAGQHRALRPVSAPAARGVRRGVRQALKAGGGRPAAGRAVRRERGAGTGDGRRRRRGKRCGPQPALPPHGASRPPAQGGGQRWPLTSPQRRSPSRRAERALRLRGGGGGMGSPAAVVAGWGAAPAKRARREGSPEGPRGPTAESDRCDPRLWDTERLCQHLSCCGVGEPSLLRRFRESGVTGSMLLDLPACALEVTRVCLPAERLKVLACLNKLRQQHVDVMKVALAPSWEGTTSRALLVLSSCLSPCLSASPPFGLVVPAGAVVVPFLCRAANSEPFSIVGGL
uniref:SAM domain-containing protein n=1 Tax=Accipiter nisus TaxID=211598 RepID=A0A8B9MRE7_9AVES